MNEKQSEYLQKFTMIFLECVDCLIRFDFSLEKVYFMPDIFCLIPQGNIRARNYIIAKHNSEKAPNSPAEIMEEIYNAVTQE